MRRYRAVRPSVLIIPILRPYRIWLWGRMESGMESCARLLNAHLRRGVDQLRRGYARIGNSSKELARSLQLISFSRYIWYGVYVPTGESTNWARPENTTAIVF